MPTTNQQTSSTPTTYQSSVQPSNFPTTIAPPPTSHQPSVQPTNDPTKISSSGEPTMMPTTHRPSLLSPITNSSTLSPSGEPTSIPTNHQPSSSAPTTNFPTEEPTVIVSEEGEVEETCKCFQYQHVLDGGRFIDILDASNVSELERVIAQITARLGPAKDQGDRRDHRHGRNLLQSSLLRGKEPSRRRHMIAEEDYTNGDMGITIRTTCRFWEQTLINEDTHDSTDASLEFSYLVTYCVADPSLLDPLIYVSKLHNNFMDWMTTPENNSWLLEHLYYVVAIPPDSGYNTLSIPSQFRCPPR